LILGLVVQGEGELLLQHKEGEQSAISGDVAVVMVWQTEACSGAFRQRYGWPLVHLVLVLVACPSCTKCACP
jgi:hypothetical protein